MDTERKSLILAIESSCDETAAAVVNGRCVLSGVVASQIELHQKFGGVVPEIASRSHAEAVAPLVREALGKAGVDFGDLSAVAVTAAPGLIGALLVGVNFAKGLALSLDIPLVPVHHLRSHIASNYIVFPELAPPFLALVVSGGHSHLVAVEDYTRFRILGRTRDDAAGECFDKAARALGLPYPGGAWLDKLAQEGDPSVYPLPRPKVEDHPLDFSFSGLKTAVVNLLHGAEMRGEEVDRASLAAALRGRVCDLLTEKTMHAAREYGFDTVAVCGGVAANSELRRRMTAQCKTEGLRCFIPPLRLCGDNAEMVGVQGYYELLAGHTAGMELNARATMEISEQF